MICRTLKIGRATAYPTSKGRPRHYRRKDDEIVVAQLRQVLRERGSYGYRRAHWLLKRDFQAGYNRKRIQRVMRLHGLALPVRGRRRRGRRHEGQVECVVSNQRWCSDVLEIVCWNTFAPHSALGMMTPAEFRREQQTVADTGCLTK